ncbi:1-deoxy-D-xylulose-5-phosphate reductoisomerase [bacterium endosymbiont of Pedicinus badii]|uniref:1-deoxy-D-xylulose-5-phosphate reductoisomerase n=1 Tax=bacterium endosymbiont of Pedicinus badii TaxID=1719126 RepID=UPI0009BA09F2|nr:1-deoxy-D-xylulose-5-phosphate reductoisomerase [bacterium endosymbiont of Pedicinus badii]OQM33997.1 1-deoxy-D-xylulose 5-phosphate reductoisomerase [bacterium endosymbiont of Pedicinus badii]
MKKKITILGSTGEIGKKCLSIIKKNKKIFEVYALIANENFSLMQKQCEFFHPKYACMVNENAAKILKKNLNSDYTVVFSGIKSACCLVANKKSDIIISAISGISGLLPTLSAIKSGRILLLANKEILIFCGKLFFKKIKKYKAKILPIDSEHSAIFQSIPEKARKKLGFIHLKKYGISKIILTASGGPCMNIKSKFLKYITPEYACTHPNWKMGKKISVDSATMMNKGLEYIEAKLLFNANDKELEVLIHPESIVHSMVQYIDGSILAQLGIPDMEIPITYALSYPKRIYVPNTELNFTKIKKLHFSKVSFKKYPCFKLSIEASKSGQTAIIALNAANEISVQSFLRKEINFTDIFRVNKYVLENLSYKNPSSIEESIQIDKLSRNIAYKKIKCITV